MVCVSVAGLNQSEWGPRKLSDNAVEWVWGPRILNMSARSPARPILSFQLCGSEHHFFEQEGPRLVETCQTKTKIGHADRRIKKTVDLDLPLPPKKYHL